MALTPAEPLNGRATVTAVIGRSETPNALEIRIRIWSASVDMCSVWRMVEFLNTASEPFYRSWSAGSKHQRWMRRTKGGGGKLAGSVSCGIDVHVSIQWPSDILGSMLCRFCNASLGAKKPSSARLGITTRSFMIDLGIPI